MPDTRVRDSIRSGARQDWWAFVESLRGRGAELMLTVGLSIWAVSLYPDNASTLTQAWIQGVTVVGGLVVAAVTAFVVNFFYKTPKRLLADAYLELNEYAALTPILTISEPAPSYARPVDGQQSVLWQVLVRNTTTLSIAKNVVLTIEEILPHTPPSFPVRLHEVVRVDYQDVGRTPLVLKRDIRHGDTVRYDVLSEPFDGRDELGRVQWHSGDFDTGTEFLLPDIDLAFLLVALEMTGSIDIRVYAVADPPCRPVSRMLRLRSPREGEHGDPQLASFIVEAADEETA